MDRSTPAVLEMGSHSLKVHYRRDSDGVIEKIRFPWSLGHEIYGTGTLSNETLEQAESAMRQLRERGFRPDRLRAIATGALRDSDECEQLRSLLGKRLGLKIRVLSGREEASMLAKGYLSTSSRLPALLGDIGGGTLELVYLSAEKTILRDSLPLGAARMYQLGLSGDGERWAQDVVERWIEQNFDEASVLTADEVHCTGGTVKAAAKMIGNTSFSAKELRSLIDAVQKSGPPLDVLDAPRARVFLPGLLVLDELLRHSHARTMHYTKISVGKVFLEYLLKRPRRDVEAMHLTTIYPDRRRPSR